jgi:hypothetical protein
VDAAAGITARARALLPDVSPLVGVAVSTRRCAVELVIGVLVVVGIVLLLGRLADWLENRSFLLWLVVYIVGGGLLIILFATARTVGT